jgi:hypothetical protein
LRVFDDSAGGLFGGAQRTRRAGELAKDDPAVCDHHRDSGADTSTPLAGLEALMSGPVTEDVC